LLKASDRAVAEDPELRVSLDPLIEERYRSVFEDYLVSAVGKAVIVGRGGNFLTRGFPRGVHVRLVAPLELRIRAVADQTGASEAETKKKIAAIDRDRARLVRDYFNADIDDPLQYDAVWNTSTAPIDFIAAALVEMIRLKAEMEVGESASA